ncbi:osmoprotection protein [Helicobacter pylori]|nr:osmoprotection protein [Helicobacter pylori]PDW37298.1 osmoprotection protein [Helicobacter pylori]PDW51019.1 osmoprotection protein [Helicobacter pylori]PDW65453.1 osmoprotection protein [Helicobacter pylori]PDW80037.1 osmoprotection protein [Helicobacter pylori]
MLGMGVFKQLIKELYEWLLHSIDVATQHLVAMALKNKRGKIFDKRIS